MSTNHIVIFLFSFQAGGISCGIYATNNPGITLSSHFSRGVIVKHAYNSCCRFSIALVRCCGYPIISSWALCSYYLRMVTIQGQHLDSARRANSSNGFWKPVDQ